MDGFWPWSCLPLIIEICINHIFFSTVTKLHGLFVRDMLFYSLSIQKSNWTFIYKTMGCRCLGHVLTVGLWRLTGPMPPLLLPSILTVVTCEASGEIKYCICATQPKARVGWTKSSSKTLTLVTTASVSNGSALMKQEFASSVDGRPVKPMLQKGLSG